MDYLYVCRLSVDNIKSELKQVKTTLSKLEDQVTNAQDDIKEQFTQFLEVSTRQGPVMFMQYEPYDINLNVVSCNHS
jgi:hypothetical protein